MARLDIRQFCMTFVLVEKKRVKINTCAAASMNGTEGRVTGYRFTQKKT